MNHRRLVDTRALTGLRFLAALHVLLLHELPDQIEGASEIENILLERTAALSVFFVLSGLLISIGTGNKNWTKSRAKSFLVRRVAKTVPLYYIALLLFLPIFIYRTMYIYDSSLEKGILAVLINIFNFQSFFPHIPEPWYINRPSWTIGVFLTCYLTFPLIHNYLISCTSEKLIYYFTFFYVMSQAIVLVLEARLDIYSTELEIIHKFPFIRIFEFYMGVSIGTWIVVREKSLTISHKFVLPTSIIILLLFIFLPKQFDNYIHNGLLTPLFIILFLSSSSGKDKILNFLRKGPVYSLGLASYSFYILHLVIANYLSAIIILINGSSIRFSPEFIVINLLFVIPISRYIYDNYEEPWRKKIISYYSAKE